MPATYEPIATTTLGSASSNITFSSISSAYTDLRLVVTFTTSTSGNTLWCQLNSDTGSNYSQTYLYGNGTTAASIRQASYDKFRISDYSVVGSSTTIPSLVELDLLSYAGSTYKTFLSSSSEDFNGSGVALRSVGLWRSTSSVTSIKLYSSGGANLNTGTTATLYGIKNA